MMRRAALMAGLVALVGGSACAPRLVTQIEGEADHVRFLYNRSTLFSYETGVVHCDRTRAGELEGCNELAVQWNEN